MKTACELCTEIAVKKTLYEEERRIEKVKIVENFIEDIISPIVDNLNIIPNRLQIGYRYKRYVSYTNEFYTRIGDWKDDGVTSSGYPKKKRRLENRIPVKKIFSSDFPLDYDLLNHYLAQYGYQIFVKTEDLPITLYSSRPNSPRCTDIDVLYLSLVCPLEEENKNNA